LLISLAFWMCLLLAVSLYALVVLSPKLARCARRAEELARMQRHLCDLRQQLEFGDRLTEEWQSNPEFRASLTRGPSTDASPEGRRIRVEDGLRFQARASSFPEDPRPTGPDSLSRARRLSLKIVHAMAGSRLMQAVGLSFAAAVLVAAFTFLTDESARLPSRARMKAAFQRAHSRRTPDVR
jgi:hypothetical protein